MATVKVKAADVRKGDRADHKSRQLDPRTVTRVDGPNVYLDLFGNEIGPCPRSNYTYTRTTEES